jgi:hypothetical protein
VLLLMKANRVDTASRSRYRKPQTPKLTRKRRVGQPKRSMMVALAIPPPSHIVCKPLAAKPGTVDQSAFPGIGISAVNESSSEGGNDSGCEHDRVVAIYESLLIFDHSAGPIDRRS